VLEIIQLEGSGWREYLKDFWNTFDQISFVANATTMLIHGLNADLRV